MKIILWLCIWILALCLSVYYYTWENDFGLGLFMLFVTFPLGGLLQGALFFSSKYINLLFEIIQSYIMVSTGYAVDKNIISVIFVWMLFCVVGYMQWFIIAPWIYNKITKYFISKRKAEP